MFKQLYGIIGEHIRSGIHPETHIILPDGGIVKAKDVSTHILAYDFSYTSTTPVTTRKIMVLASKIVTIRTLHSEIKVSQNHRLLALSNNTLKVLKAKQIRVGDLLAVPFKIKVKNEKYVSFPLAYTIQTSYSDFKFNGGLSETVCESRVKNKLKSILRLILRRKVKFRSIEENDSNIAYPIRELYPVNILNEDLAQTIAYLKFSRSIVDGVMRILCRSKNVAKEYAKNLKKFIKVRYKIYRHRNSRLWAIEFSKHSSSILKHVVKYVNTVFNVISRSPASVIAAFISGLYDATGKVDNGVIEITVDSIDTAFKLQLLMLRLGVYPYITRCRETGTVKLRIRGIINTSNFLSTVGRYVYSEINVKPKRDIDDIVPLTGNVKNLLEAETEIAYINGYYVVPREKLQKVIQSKYLKYYNLTSVRDSLTEALYLLSFRWDPVIAVRVEEYNGPLYDFYVPLYHNYIAGPFVVYSSHTTLLSP
ncbi:MAG TPA: hypothetical protein EYH40_05125 [Desulfurococcales archaeon]|nr:hypothetical protein [Desulfurococcales archaeon]